MDTQAVLNTISGFFVFLSTNYGTGNLSRDLLIVAGGLLLLMALISILKMSSNVTPESAGELEEIELTVNRVQIQMSELRTGITNELEKWRKELETIRHDMAHPANNDTRVGLFEGTSRSKVKADGGIADLFEAS